MKEMYFQIIATTICFLLGFETLSQDLNNPKLNKNDYPFLSEKEVQFANKKNDFKMGASDYAWKEWEGNQETETNINIVYKEAEEPNKMEGMLIFGKDTFQIYGTNGSASIWSDKLKGMMYIYQKTEPDEFDYYFDPHVASINLEGKKYKIEIVVGRSSFYEESEIELISDVNDFKFTKNSAKLTEYTRDSITLKYYSVQAVDKETGNQFEKVNGILSIGNLHFDIFGSITEFEGVWGFASLWQGDENRGVISWEAYEDIDSSIVDIKYCKQERIQFCDFTRFVLIKETPHKKNNPFGSGGNNTNGGFGNDIGSGGQFGNDAGSGSGSGGNGSGRVRLNDPNIDHIETNVNSMVSLKLTVNENGEVVTASSTSKTTTTEQRIISQVISAVKQQVRYNKSFGSGLQVVYLTVKLTAK